MIPNFDDFCLWMYVVIDDLWKTMEPRFRRPGPASACSDSELLTLAVVGECCGWDTERVLLSQWRQHQDLFPCLPERTRFNRRRRQLAEALTFLRQVLLRLLDLAHDRQCAIDSLPVPVVQFYHVPQASSEWKEHGAAFGKVSSKKQTIFGYKLHLLITLNGLILDFILAPANLAAITVGEELLEGHTDLAVLGDKAYLSAPLATRLQTTHRITLWTLPRSNQNVPVPPPVRRRHNGAREIIETVNGQLTAQLQIQLNHAHTLWGLCARLLTKLTAHTLCVYLNRVLGKPDVLQIKALAFPI